MKYKMIRAAVFSVALCSVSAAFASDPQMFVYRNDGGFHATHLRQGVGATHSSVGADDDFIMHLLGEDGRVTDIPVSAIDSCVVRLTDIPTLHLTLPDYPEVPDVWSKEDYASAILDIEGNGYCDDMEGLELSVRGRGNSTWTMPKKPMRLKFPKKLSLFGLAKQKNYVLLANYIDGSLMKNAVAFWIARRLGVPYANHTVPVNVVLNGHHRGSYLLTEKVGINSGSVDIDESKGILFEMSVEFDEPYKFRSARWNLPVMVKDPDFDELAEDDPEGPTASERLAQWQADFNAAEGLAAGGRGFEAFDRDSFVRAMLLYDICLNSEIGYPKSLYVHKESLGPETLYKFGPAWDFDVAFNFRKPTSDGGFETTSPRGNLWVNDLMGSLMEGEGFMAQYSAILDRFAAEDLPDLLDFISTYASQIEPSAMIDAQVWPVSGQTSWYYRETAAGVRAQAAELRTWLTERVAYLRERASSSEF